MKAKKNKRERSPQMHQVSAGQINQLRAQVLQDLVLLGEGEDWSQKSPEERPRCATCDKPLWARGKQTRFIQTSGGEAVKLTLTYGACPACWMPYASAQELLQDLLGVRVSKATARRVTLATGETGLAVCEGEEVCLEQISSFSRLADAERFAHAAEYIHEIGQAA